MVSRNLGPCLVCGDTAVGINFAVATCAPCKAFFRRNAVKLGRVDFICQRDGDCLVTYRSRRMCNCCRLAKCFRVGMQKCLIRSEAEREARKDVVQQNRDRRVILSKSQKNESIRPSNLLCSSENQSRCLSTSDQALLTNIYYAYERTCKILKSQCPQFPTIEHSSIRTFFNEYSVRQKSLIEYFKIIPEFNRLSIDDKVRLVKNHLATMISINEPILDGSLSPALTVSIKNVFTPDIASNILRSAHLMCTYMHDPILLKLLLIVQTLSSSINRYRNDDSLDFIYDDTHTIFAGQNIYIELLWRYILSRTASERDAVKFFNKLILDLLFTQHVYFTLGSVILRSYKTEIDQLEPLMQSMWPR